MSRPVRAVLGTALLPVLLVPVDFLADARWAVIAVSAAAVLGWLALARIASRPTAGAARLLLGALLLSTVLTAAVTGTVVGTAGTYGVLAAGTALGALLGHRLRAFLLALLLVSAAVLLLEALLVRHVYLDLLGTPLMEYLGVLDFRSRGVQGHPIPAAFALSAVALTLWFAAPAGRATAYRVAVAGSLAVVLGTTGTRSAVVALAVVLGVVVLGSRHRTAGVLTLVAATWSVLVALLVAQVWPTADLLPRSLDFAGLEGTQSVSIRAAGPEALAALAGGCSAACHLAGHGSRSLQEDLPSVRAVAGPSTVDNQLLTSWYDLGLLGVLVLVVVLVLAVRGLRGAGDDGLRRGAALGVLLLLVGGLFFDVLYVSNTAAVLGCLLAVTMVTTSGGGRGRAQDAGPVGLRGHVRA